MRVIEHRCLGANQFACWESTYPYEVVDSLTGEWITGELESESE